MSDLLATSSLAGLALELRTDTQHATAYLDGRPLCTVQRGGGAPWVAYRTDGASVLWANRPESIVRHVERYAATIRERGGFPPACTVELAPDYEKRPLALCVMRTADGKRWQLGGVTMDGAHTFARLSYLGAKLTPFRTRGEAWEFCALVGLTPAMPVRSAALGRVTYIDQPSASPVACVGGLPMRGAA